MKSDLFDLIRVIKLDDGDVLRIPKNLTDENIDFIKMCLRDMHPGKKIFIVPEGVEKISNDELDSVGLCKKYNSLSVESLISEIRTAKDLDYLYRLIGPSEKEKEHADSRLRALDDLWEKSIRENWGQDISLWPGAYKHRYFLLQSQQTEFENTYL